MPTLNHALIASRYRIIKEIGRGGMGAVYLVKHERTGEYSALKVLHESEVRRGEALDRFQREMRLPAKIRSEHIARITDADVAPELGGAPFFVMELLRGADLGKILSSAGPRRPEEVAWILGQAAKALEKAHALDIVHRDLKPENLFVHIKEDGGFVTKVVDFGIAKVRDDLRASAGKRAAQTLNAVGTPLYMSPEQAKGPSPEDPPVGPSCDIWAVGMMAVELLTGDPYWTADSPMALLGQIFFAPMKPPSGRSPVLGTKFDHWFARSCDRNPANRWVSASKQFDALLDALHLRAAPSEIPESLAVQVVGLTRHLEELAVDEPSLYRIVNPKRDDSHDTLVGANRPGTVASSRDADSIPSAIAEAPTEKFDSKRHAAPLRDTVPDAPSEALLTQSREGSAPMPINDLPTEPFDPKKHRPAPGKTAPSLRDSSSPTPLTDAPTSALAPKSGEPATMPLGVLRLGQVAPSRPDPRAGQRDAASQQGAQLQAVNRIPQWVVFVAGIGVGLLALLTRC